jgi:ABC-2 type transport system permease protein
LFFIYSVAKPVSAALILVVMLEVVGGATAPQYRAYVVVGSALWSLVLSGIAGLAFAILDDRERYRMLKYVYVSPSDFLIVLLGRGVARLAVGAAGAAITLAVGVVALGVPFDAGSVDWMLLAVATVAGLASIVAIGVAMAAICIQTRQESWSYPDAVAGSLFLVSGAVFPLAVLPTPLQAAGLLSPLTWWIEATRRALLDGAPSGLGGGGSFFAAVSGGTVPDPAGIAFALLATGAVTTLAARAVFRASDRRARDRGLLDRTTGS